MHYVSKKIFSIRFKYIRLEISCFLLFLNEMRLNAVSPLTGRSYCQIISIGRSSVFFSHQVITADLILFNIPLSLLYSALQNFLKGFRRPFRLPWVLACQVIVKICVFADMTDVRPNGVRNSFYQIIVTILSDSSSCFS